VSIRLFKLHNRVKKCFSNTCSKKKQEEKFIVSIIGIEILNRFWMAYCTFQFDKQELLLHYFLFNEMNKMFSDTGWRDKIVPDQKPIRLTQTVTGSG
jgi:hypothetical protein